MFVLTHPAAFDEFSKLPPPLFPAAAKIMKLSNAYVVFNDSQKVASFNWGGFKDAVVAHPGTDLAFDKLQSTSITNQLQISEPSLSLSDIRDCDKARTPYA